MSIWKSPVFYFGVLLLMVVLAALVAPFVINWNVYRGDLEAYGRKLTGREVQISGPIDVKLFPWPRLNAADVRIANPADNSPGNFLTADKIAVQLSLAGLFNGSLDVEAIELEAPQLVIFRNLQGRLNWQVAPDQALAKTGLLKRVKLDQILIHNGTIRLEDEARGYSAGISKLEARLSAPAIDGPWKLSGTAEFHDEPISLNIGTGDIEPGQPVKLSARVIPGDTAMPVFSVDGEWNGDAYAGTLRIDPNTGVDQKQSAEGSLRPLKLQSEFNATTDEVQFSKIKISPADVKDSGTLIEGSGQLSLSKPAQLKLALTSPRVNLDTLLGAESLSQWRDGGLLLLANGIFQSMPEDLSANVEMAVNVLTSGGDTLNSVTVKGSLDRLAIRINEASAALPGLSEARFDGVLFPGEGAAELGGKLEFQSGDFRTFLGWLAPERKSAIDAAWKGGRGRVVLVADADWTQSRFGLQNLKFELDGAPGSGQVVLRLGRVPGIDLNLDVTRLDLDSLLPQGFTLWPNGNSFALSTLVTPLVTGEDVSERHISIKVGTLLLNGVTAKQAELDLTTSLSGVEIKSLRVSDIDGASFSTSGLLLSSPDGPSGDLKFGLLAKEPMGFLRLAGLAGKGSPGYWTTALGETALNLQLTAGQTTGGLELSIAGKGTSGTLAMEGSGKLSQLARLSDARLSFTGRLNSSDGSNLLRLAGVRAIANDAEAGTATLTMDGSWTSGFATSFSADVLDAQATYKGRVHMAQPWLGLNGEARIAANSVQKLKRVLGLPFRSGAEGSFGATGLISVEGEQLKLNEIAGSALGNAFGGTAAANASGALSGDFTSDYLKLSDLMSWGLFDWDGKDVSLASSFADSKSLAMPVQLFLQPRALDLGLGSNLGETVVGYGANGDGVTVSLLQPGPDSQKLEMILRPSGPNYDVSLKGRLQLDIAAMTRLANGEPAAAGRLKLDGEATGSGRSPAAAIASLGGKGEYWVSGGKLNGITIQGHEARVTSATNQDELKAALATLDGPPGTDFGERVGRFELVSGAANFTAFAVDSGGTTATVETAADLPEGTLSMTTTVNIASRTDLPPVSISYLGRPGALAKRAATAALAAKLGYQLLAKDMAELEAVQKQQAALAAQEEAQRQEDEARFAAYQQQRDELRKRLRERRVFANERAARSADLKTGLARAMAIGDAMNKADLAARLREKAAKGFLMVTP